MAHTQYKNDDALEILRLSVRKMASDLEDSSRHITKKPVRDHLQNLRATVYNIDSTAVIRPAPLERYMKNWADFIGGIEESLDEKAVRFLCWVPQIAVDVRFLAYAAQSGLELKRRCLVGLVRSIHCMWKNLSPENPSVRIVKALLHRYKGTDAVLRAWQIHSNVLLSPEAMAHNLLNCGKNLSAFIDIWRIESQSSFLRDVVEITTAAARNTLGHPTRSLLVLLFRDLLPWPGWQTPCFKKQIGAIILHQPMSRQSREMLQRFILHFKGLGDPRIPDNQLNWAEVPREAKSRLIQWLQEENPYAFPERVYQQDKGWIWERKASIYDPLSFGEEYLQ